MIFKDNFTNLSKNPQFEEWNKEHPNAYLASFFLIKERNEVKIAFYNPDNKKFTTFIPNPFQKLPEDDVLADAIPKRLEFDKVKLNISKALEIADKELNKKGKQIVNQTVVILQKLDEIIYNITFVTMTFNIVNIRINAIDGAILKTDVSNLMDFGKMS